MYRRYPPKLGRAANIVFWLLAAGVVALMVYDVAKALIGG